MSEESKKKELTRGLIEEQLQGSINEANDLASKLDKVRGVIGYLKYMLSTYEFPKE